MAEPFLGEIRRMTWAQTPRGWAACNGALLPIAQNLGLFARLGIRHGGDGIELFALPNFDTSAGVRLGIALGGSNGPTE